MANSLAGAALGWIRGGAIGQQAQTWYTGSVSAATIGWITAPFSSFVSGYWTQDAAAVATANNVLVYAGSSASGGLIATITVASGGGPGDTYSWTTATPNTVVAAGQPLSFNFNTTATGTAYGQIVTVVFTKAVL